MWECKYGKEPLDTRLCFLRLLRKSWLVLVMALIGAILFGTVYFISHVVYAPAREYVTISEFYIDYVGIENYEDQYMYYNNNETWDTLVHSDIFMDEVMTKVNTQTSEWDREITREEAGNAISATLGSDIRIIRVRVTTNSPELTMIIANSLESAFVKFAESQKEIDTRGVLTLPREATLVAIDNHTVRACILGAVVFVCFTLFFMYLYVVLDTSIYIPLEFERRYKIPMECDEEKNYDSDNKEESVYYTENSDGTLVLFVKSKDHNGPLIEQTIYRLTAQGKIISKAVLTHADNKLIKWYFKTGRWV